MNIRMATLLVAASLVGCDAIIEEQHHPASAYYREPSRSVSVGISTESDQPVVRRQYYRQYREDNRPYVQDDYAPRYRYRQYRYYND